MGAYGMDAAVSTPRTPRAATVYRPLPGAAGRGMAYAMSYARYVPYLQTKRQYCTDAITIRRDEAHACGCGLHRGLLRGA
eukprot:4471440-Prymnesium_polylepis.1